MSNIIDTLKQQNSGLSKSLDEVAKNKDSSEEESTKKAQKLIIELNEAKSQITELSNQAKNYQNQVEKLQGIKVEYESQTKDLQNQLKDTSGKNS